MTNFCQYSTGIWSPFKKETYSGRRAEIEHDLALLEEAILLVELDQLEGGTRAVSLLLGELVPLVETALAVLLLDRHGAGCLSQAMRPLSVGWILLSRASARTRSPSSPSLQLTAPKFLAETQADKR